VPTDVAAARRRFDEQQAEFRRVVVEAVTVEGQKKFYVARDAAITRQTLDAWIRQAADACALPD
jgi:transposase-like protein